MLSFQNGELFASGVMEYEFRGATDKDINARIFLRIEIDGIPSIAAVDTGAPYLILAPVIANRLSFDLTTSLDNVSINNRGDKFYGNLFRVDVLLPAFEGISQQFQATVFVPNPDEEAKWGDRPTFLGMQSCLDRKSTRLNSSH